MINAILVDDEPMAMKRLKKILQSTGLVLVKNMYTVPQKALQNLIQDDPEIAFLDIEMPRMSGLILAKEMQSMKPGLEVVVVTAHSQYALDAFKVRASGFLLKPVDLKDASDLLLTLMHRKKKGMESQEATQKAKRMYVSSFGSFAIYTNVERPRYLQWRTSKTREFFAFLHYHQGQPVMRDAILEALWPDMNPEKAEKNFYTTSCYLRKMLKVAGLNEAIERQNGTYRLRLELFESDERKLIHHLNRESSSTQSLQDLETMAELYRGDYCGCEDYPWAAGKRAYYEHQIIRVLWQMYDKYQQMRDHSKVFHVLHQLLNIDPYHDTAQQKILEHLKTNGHQEKITQYYAQFHQFY